ncbi:unnamed protein product [Caenorhabditis auriculariae]|uniref:Catalase n=1 Tax=Caenorhabditis auriculariae TaxID=2777116 RepID=A0A8S1HAP0_9PELO|nr:unnamed protein product [Caenorhabditis auriculariae]
MFSGLISLLTGEGTGKLHPNPPCMTLSNGAPICCKTASLTAGPRGPMLLQDVLFLDEMTHFDHERCPERVVHAKGGGAHGYFEVTRDITKICKAEMFSEIGKKTPMLARFSTAGGERGSPDSVRDPRGFALKFYTEEGNWDLVCNNTPIFFFRDPMQFPSFVNCLRKNPQTHVKDWNMMFDFFQSRPETIHQVMILYSDRGIPCSYRHMNGYGGHAFKMINQEGKATYVKFHFKTQQGIRNFTPEEASKMVAEDCDCCVRDLFDSIEKGDCPEWKMYIQVMTFEQAEAFPFNPFDVTKVWPHADFPLMEVGRMVLDRNPMNYFTEVEQAAFTPSHAVPGIDFSPDRMLQARLFSYKDSQYHRIGPNYMQLPINCPYRSRVANNMRDGYMALCNQCNAPNYHPNTFNGPKESTVERGCLQHSFPVVGDVGRYDDSDDHNFEQPRDFWTKVLDENARRRLCENMVEILKKCYPRIQDGMVDVCTKVHTDFGTCVRQLLDTEKMKEMKSKNKQSGCARNSVPTSMKWHPIHQFVAVGWLDGCVCLVPVGGPILHNVADVGGNEVSFIDWSHEGNTLMTMHSPSVVVTYSLSMGKQENVTTGKKFQIDLRETVTCQTKKLLFEVPSVVSQEETDDMELKLLEDKMAVAKVPRKPIGTEFLFGTDNGSIFSVAESDKKLVHKLDSGVLFIAYCEPKELIILFTQDVFIYHLLNTPIDGRVEKVKVKLGGKASNYKLELNESMLVMCWNERDMRVWDLMQEENGTVSLETSKGFDQNDIIQCVTVNAKKGIISGGTMDGKVANWKRRKGDTKIDSMWKLQTSNIVGKDIVQIRWSPIVDSVAVVTSEELVILEDDNFIVRMRNKIAVIQTSSNTFTLLNAATGVNQDLKLPISARGICLGDKQLVVWSDDTIMTYDVQSSLATIQSTSFACVASDVVITNQTLYCIEKDKVNSRTLQGTIRQIISLPEMEGDPVSLNLNRHWLVIGSSHGFVRIYNLSKKEAHQEHNAKYVIENVPSFSHFSSVKINPAGNKVACTFYENPTSLSELLLIFDAESDSITYFSFDKGMTDTQEYEAQAELAQSTEGRPVTAAARKMAREQTRFQMMYHRPGEMYWDDSDGRYLVVECMHMQQEMNDNRILTMFVTSEHGILLQDVQRKSAQCGRLVSVAVPVLYFVKKIEWEEEEVKDEKTIGRALIGKTLREFSGVENCDEATRKAMMDFCYYLILGSMDAAFKAIQFIKSESVWEQMASMSVKTGRLDVAVVCLGHMKNVRGARAIRKSQQAGENESMQCAALAVELGMLDDAQRLYASNERWDLVNKIYQQQNLWNQAFQIAETKDRIHLRNTHYNYAKHLEEYGNLEQAIENYEKAGVHQFEVPRMYANEPKQLENYVRRKRDPDLHKYWAGYMESIGEYDGAYNFYSFAKDFLAMAAQIALESADKAACFRMGRLYEAENDIQKAVLFYTKARALSSAIRLAREHDMKDRLANLSLMAGGNDLVEAARYYEDLPGYAHKAVMLYHKAGMIGRALDLAFRTEQFTALDLITKDLDANTDPQILKRAAEFFEGNQNYEKAVNFLCMAKEV